MAYPSKIKMLLLAMFGEQDPHMGKFGKARKAWSWTMLFMQPDFETIEHLFTLCTFSTQVWRSICSMLHIDSLEEISTQNGPFNFKSNSMSSCVSQ